MARHEYAFDPDLSKIQAQLIADGIIPPQGAWLKPDPRSGKLKLVVDTDQGGKLLTPDQEAKLADALGWDTGDGSGGKHHWLHQEEIEGG